MNKSMEIQDKGLLVIGSGHAGSELAIAALQGGWAGPITLVGDEAALPYHRPPLSKAYLCGQSDAEAIRLRPAAAYGAAGIERLVGMRMVAIDRRAKRVAFADGRQLGFGKLALCLGGRPRPFVCEGIDAAAPPSNLLYLRTLADADRIRDVLRPGARLVVLGGGYVGLEVAASAAILGVHVTIIEAQPRVLARVAGPELSGFYESVHRDHGVGIITGCGVARVECEGGSIKRIECSDGRILAADAVVAGIGMLPNVDAAVAANLGTVEGLLVDENSCTVDSNILAAGDCTRLRHPLYDKEIRIESVPNALEQARAAAGWLCGKPKPYRSVPWFWSDQYDLKLQMAGLSHGFDRCVMRGSTASRSFCAFYLREDRLLAVDAVNRPSDFMAVRRALVRPLRIDPSRLADESVTLKEQLA